MRKLTGLFFIVLSVCLMAAGCINQPSEEDEHKGDEISLYYLNSTEDDFFVKKYTLANADDPVKESQEVLGLLANRDEADSAEYKISVPDEVGVNSIKVKKGTEVIDFGSGYHQMDAVTESMMRIAVVKTLTQIDGVDKVTFTINGESLLGYDGNPIKEMTADQIILSQDFNSIYTQKKKVTLYYSDTKGQKLIAHKVTLTAKDNQPMTDCILETLKKAPEDQDKMISPLPEGLVINQTQIVGNICYVDLSSEIHNLVPDVEEEVTVYSMVNSIASLNDTYQVQFTVDGERVKNLNGFDGFDRPLSENRELK